MSSSTLGTYRNPPLAYVVAEVVLAPHYGISAIVSGVQERLRAAYPRTQEGTELTVELNASPTPPPPQQVWRFLAADQQRGVAISSHGFSLHSTKYSNFEEFSAAWDAVLEVMGDSIDNAFVERIGLRYVDFIVPSDGHSCDEYLAAGRVIAPYSEARVESNFWIAAFIAGAARVNARVAAPSPAGMLLPPNINTLPLQKPTVWTLAEAHLKANKQIGFIDTDCTQPIEDLFDYIKLSKAFREVKAHISTTFKGLMSELAKKEWI